MPLVFCNNDQEFTNETCSIPGAASARQAPIPTVLTNDYDFVPGTLQE